jgi:hypothetical protein
VVGQAISPGAPMSPERYVLPAGSELWRCHETRFEATAFNPNPVRSRVGGGRFDGTQEDPYPFLYAAPDPATALAEVLLRDMEFSGPYSVRLVPWADVVGRTLSKVRTTEDLLLVRLIEEEDLAAVFQTSRLLETTEYHGTRQWASRMRGQVPDAPGLWWQSRWHRPRGAMVLFGDRCGAEPLKAVPGHAHNLGTLEGAAEANRLLAPLRAVIAPPGVSV